MMRPYAAGIDIGGTTVKMGLFRADGERLDAWEIPTRTENGGEAVLPDIADALFARLERLGIGAGELEGAGIGVPGTVLSGGIADRCPNLGWHSRNVAEEAARLLGMPVRVENDANVAAFGEQRLGAGRGCEDMIMITLGTGVGCGVILNGRIYGGAHGFAGEVGHMQMRTDEQAVCGCGKRGCLEQYASANGVARLAGVRLAEDSRVSLLRSVTRITSRDVFDAARNGDGPAADIVEEACGMLGRALSYLACTLDPEIFVIGGGMAAAGDLLIETIRKTYREAVHPSLRGTPVVRAELGGSAGISGAAAMIIAGMHRQQDIARPL